MDHEHQPQELKHVPAMPEQPKIVEPAMTQVERMIVSKLWEPESRHMNFFKSLLPTLEKFCDRQTLYSQWEVLKLTQQVSDVTAAHCPHLQPILYIDISC